MTKNKKIEIVNPTENKISQPVLVGQKPFFVSGWLPYWAKETGVNSLEGNLKIFDEINPFDFGVTPDGNIVDTVGIDNAPWRKLRAEAEKENIKIIPTILWGDAAAMHRTFANPELLDHHVGAIVDMLADKNFPGVDIDYEGKDIVDRDNFSAFVKTLHSKLQAAGKSLSCTIEARTEDSPPAGLVGTRAMSWANDHVALNENCDSVRVMAYDQVFQINSSNTFENLSEIPSAPNADNKWVQQVVQYALQKISPDKLVLGIPTYGWEFRLTKLDKGYQYVRLKSISHPDALKEASDANVTPVRSDGGEMTFTYVAKDGKHIVTFEDAEAVRQKIEIAQKLNIKGISLFKIDGLSDPQLFPMLTKLIMVKNEQ
ncbi:MAG: glycosyl hydrolase family 18 protein [Candidatus Moranbacteria bacterium]|nr:glycosyl hydrolase family 18 protein [Candidatus Moranbacteria bacterium]